MELEQAVEQRLVRQYLISCPMDQAVASRTVKPSGLVITVERNPEGQEQLWTFDYSQCRY